MRRRDFIQGIAVSATAWPLAARAQQEGRLPTIGFVGAASPSTISRWTTAFVQELRNLGWIEGRTVAIEYRFAEGRNERYDEIAAEFVRLKVDVIVTPGGGTLAMKQATSTIPVVFTAASDPVASGLVASLVRPGGNITGFSNQNADVAGKRLELLREIVPGMRRLAILTNAGYTGSKVVVQQTEAAAHILGLDAVTVEIRRAADIVPAFAALKDRADAVYVVGDPLVNTNGIRINILAAAARLPTSHGFRELVETGGLMSYGPDFADLYVRAAGYVDKILRGAKPGDLPVEQPTKFELAVNLTTAEALGLRIPESFLARADEVIE
jgi:putative tryptophan/tyrosine transport system substrate-binding protein